MENTTEIYGKTEFGKILGWSAKKTETYYLRGLLPPPTYTAGNRPFWSKQQVESFVYDPKKSSKKEVTI